MADKPVEAVEAEAYEADVKVDEANETIWSMKSRMLKRLLRQKWLMSLRPIGLTRLIWPTSRLI